jgi:hypothetical protein
MGNYEIEKKLVEKKKDKRWWHDIITGLGSFFFFVICELAIFFVLPYFPPGRLWLEAYTICTHPPHSLICKPPLYYRPVENCTTSPRVCMHFNSSSIVDCWLYILSVGMRPSHKGSRLMIL